MFACGTRGLPVATAFASTAKEGSAGGTVWLPAATGGLPLADGVLAVGERGLPTAKELADGRVILLTAKGWACRWQWVFADGEWDL